MTVIRGLISRNLNICLIVFSSVFVILRIYVRAFMTKSLGLDDAFSVAALPVLLAQSSLEIREVSHGAGMHVVDISPESFKKFASVLPTMSLLYFVAMALVRLAIIAFLPRLTKEKKFVYLSWALGAVVVSMTLICCSILLFECKHVPDLWDKGRPGAQCSSSHEPDIFRTQASIGLVIDILLFVVPIWIIYSRMVFSATTKRVLLVFSVGLLVVITGAVRLGVILTTDFSVDTTFNIIKTTVLTDLEGHVGLWVACFPTLQPLLRIVTRSLGLSSKSRIATLQKASNNLKIGQPRTQGYVQHGPKRVDSLSDDASGKGIMGHGGREVDLEMNYLGNVTATPPLERERDWEGGNKRGIMRTTDIVVSHH